MNLTSNQEQIREYAASKGIFIQVYKEEKLSIWTDSETVEYYKKGSTEKLKQVFENQDPMSYEEYNNTYKLPFYLFDTSIYKDETLDIPDKVLDLFKEDKLLDDIVDELWHVE